MASYGWDYGRRDRGRGGYRRGRPGGRFDSAGQAWGTHRGESFVEDYGSYGTPLEGGADPALSEGGFAPGGGAPWLGPGWGRRRGPGPEPGPQRWERVRGGFAEDLGRGYDRAFRSRFGGRGYDRGWRGRGGW